MKKTLAIGLWVIAITLGLRNYQLLTLRLNIPKPYRSLYEETLMPVVKIETASSTGSGVIISSEDGKTYILTAAHVVGNESTVQVITYSYHQDTPPLARLTRMGGKSPSCLASCLSAFVVITDTTKDLALLRLNPSNPSNLWLRSAKLAPRNYTPYLFTEVYAVGCSLGLDPRPSEGIISAVSNTDWEISAPIIPGNSGGGVFLKSTHELIGIAVWIRTYGWQLIPQMSGIVPINQIYEFLDKTPGVNSEEDKRQGLTVGQAGVPSAQSGQEGPVGQPNR